ncbi:MAG: hypothetical protein WKF31_00340 [Thermoleophilaceae bacterium]
MGAERSAPSAGAPCDPAVPGVLLGVIGWPVGHSRSPAMQGAALAALGLPWRYVRLPVPVELLEETVRALAGSGFRGANVTIPHKEGALRLADSATPAARAIGAANTLTFTADGVHADNTDAGGLIDALEVPMAGRRALVLGAGGRGGPRRGRSVRRARRSRSGIAPPSAPRRWPPSSASCTRST